MLLGDLAGFMKPLRLMLKLDFLTNGMLLDSAINILKDQVNCFHSFLAHSLISSQFNRCTISRTHIYVICFVRDKDCTVYKCSCDGYVESYSIIDK